jgi:hypothetical protein
MTVHTQGVDDILELSAMALTATLLHWGLAASRHQVRRAMARFCAWAILGLSLSVVPVSLLLIICLAMLGANVEALDDLAAMSPDDGIAYNTVLVTDGFLNTAGLLLGLGGLFALRRAPETDPAPSP